MRNALNTTIIICTIMLIVYFINEQFTLGFHRYGIVPKSIDSLPHIFTAPFLHGNRGHLFSNLVGLAIFTFIISSRGFIYYLLNSVFLIVFSGLFVWLLARQGMHLGASGWIFGMWSFVIARALYERSFVNLVIATAVIFFHGGMIYGLLPVNPQISFEAHVGGAIGGVFCAYFMRRKKTK